MIKPQTERDKSSFNTDTIQISVEDIHFLLLRKAVDVLVGVPCKEEGGGGRGRMDIIHTSSV